MLPTQSAIEAKAPLEDNFFKARMEPTKLIKQKGLLEFLEENYLQQYVGVLEEGGVHEVQDLARMYGARQILVGTNFNRWGLKLGIR